MRKLEEMDEAAFPLSKKYERGTERRISRRRKSKMSTSSKVWSLRRKSNLITSSKVWFDYSSKVGHFVENNFIENNFIENNFVESLFQIKDTFDEVTFPPSKYLCLEEVFHGEKCQILG